MLLYFDFPLLRRVVFFGMIGYRNQSILAENSVYLWELVSGMKNKWVLFYIKVPYFLE